MNQMIVKMMRRMVVKIITFVIIISGFLMMPSCRSIEKELKDRPICELQNTDVLFGDSIKNVVTDTSFINRNSKLVKRYIVNYEVKSIDDFELSKSIDIKFSKKWIDGKLVMERISTKVPLETFELYFLTLKNNVLPSEMNLTNKTPYSNFNINNCKFRYYSNILNVRGYVDNTIELYIDY